MYGAELFNRIRGRADVNWIRTYLLAIPEEMRQRVANYKDAAVRFVLRHYLEYHPSIIDGIHVSGMCDCDIGG